MNTFVHTGEILGGIIVIFIVTAILSFAIYAVKSSREKQAKAPVPMEKDAVLKTGGSSAEKTKKKLAGLPAWVLSSLTILGGWASLMFAVWIFWPSAWLWLSLNPAFIWAAPLCLAVSGVLYASKKGGAQMIAILIVAVLVIAAIGDMMTSWTGTTGVQNTRGNQTASALPASYGDVSAGYTRWDKCTRIRQTMTVYAPVGSESPCYLISGDSWTKMDPKSPVQMHWQNGEVYADGPEKIFQPRNGIRYAAFRVMSLSGQAVPVMVYVCRSPSQCGEK